MTQLNGTANRHGHGSVRLDQPKSENGRMAVNLMLGGLSYIEAAKRLGLKMSTTDKWYWRFVHPAKMQAEIDLLKSTITPKRVSNLTERIAAAVDAVREAAGKEIAGLKEQVRKLTAERDAWKYEAEQRAGQPIVGLA